MPITHQQQKERWEKEHQVPFALKQMDAKKLSSGVRPFLEFLEKQGFAHRIESLNAYVACRHGETPHVAAFLICDCCKSSREIEAAGSAELSALGAAQGFVLGGVTIEGRGLCAACAPKAA